MSRSLTLTAAAIGNYLIDVHIELRAASRHPDVQREHLPVVAAENFITALNDQSMPLIVKLAAGVVGAGGSFLQGGVGADHLAWDQIAANAEMFK
jgi:hypothetical protein